MLCTPAIASHRARQNPAVIAATQTDAEWLPLHSALFVKYFGSDSTGAPPEFVTKVDMPTLITALSMTGFALLYAFVNGDWGPGIPGPAWLRHAIQQPKPNADMTDEAAALMGDDLAVRCGGRGTHARLHSLTHSLTHSRTHALTTCLLGLCVCSSRAT